MLWSLVKIVFFVALIATLALGAGALMEFGGGVRLVVANTEFTLGPLQAVILALVLLTVVWMVLKLLGLLIATFRFLNGDDTAITRYFDRNRERRGFEALSDGILALASGEGRLAMIKAARAEKYLRRPELTNLIVAQAAEMTGETRKAETAYKRLLFDERTRFVALRGIMKQKLAEGDTATALKLAEKAFALRPRHEETQDVLLALQAGGHDWKGARTTLAAKLRGGTMPRDVHKRRDAVLALQEAKEVLDEGNSIEAREAAIAANRASPDLIPAAAMAARSYISKGDGKSASRVLKTAWEAQPHPDLAAAFAEIVSDETPEARLKRFILITKLRPEHIETKLLLAELNLAAGNYPAARKSVGDLVESHPNQRVLTIMAAIERGEGSPDAVVRGWLTRALTASRGPQWVCDKCQNIHMSWGPVCNNCGGFDTLSWREPQFDGGPSATGTELLPLIVGMADPVPPDLVTDAEFIEPDPMPAR